MNTNKITLQRMKKRDVSVLYDIAKSGFQPDHDKYGVYPPVIKEKNKRFLPPLILGKTIFYDGKIIGGCFVLAFGKKGEIGSIFIDPIYQGKGYGHIVMRLLESMYPKVKIWKLEVLKQSIHLHKFYESLGYIRVGENKDIKNDIELYIYEKR